MVLTLRPGVNVVKGQELTVFNSVRQPEKVEGARRPPGEIVAIRGTVKIIDFNADTHMARAVLTESVDVVERGAKVRSGGPSLRRRAADQDQRPRRRSRADQHLPERVHRPRSDRVHRQGQ